MPGTPAPRRARRDLWSFLLPPWLDALTPGSASGAGETDSRRDPAPSPGTHWPFSILAPWLICIHNPTFKSNFLVYGYRISILHIVWSVKSQYHIYCYFGIDVCSTWHKSPAVKCSVWWIGVLSQGWAHRVNVQLQNTFSTPMRHCNHYHSLPEFFPAALATTNLFPVAMDFPALHISHPLN